MNRQRLKDRVRELLAEHSDAPQAFAPDLLNGMADLVIELANEIVQDTFHESHPELSD
jgi:hypothetical protein